MSERLSEGQLALIEELAKKVSPATAWRYTPDLAYEIRECWVELETLRERVIELQREIEALD